MPRVSVILVNWNRLSDTLENVASLKTQRYSELEIIVVDNGSTDASVEVLSEVDGIVLIARRHNDGPAAARNVGAEHATGKYLLFLDSDALISKRGVRRLVDLMEADPTISVAGCHITNYHTRRVDQWIYGLPYRRYEAPFDSYSFSAAGAMIRAETFFEVGGYWGDLFMYNEEVDLSIAISKIGGRIVYMPSVRVYHKVSPEGRQPSSSYFHLQSRNWMWIFYKHYPFVDRCRAMATYAVVYLVKGALSGRLWACTRGLFAGVWRWDLAAAFPEKMSREQVRAYEKLNPRSGIRYSSPTTSWGAKFTGHPYPDSPVARGGKR